MPREVIEYRAVVVPIEPNRLGEFYELHSDWSADRRKTERWAVWVWLQGLMVRAPDSHLRGTGKSRGGKLMGRCIVKLADDEYVEWSSVVDAPVSWIKTRSAAVELWTEERVARADAHGDSYLDGHIDIDAFNQAGDNEEMLTRDEIRAKYRGPEATDAVKEGESDE